MPLFVQVRDKMLKEAEANLGTLFPKFRNKVTKFDIQTKLQDIYKYSFAEIEKNPFMQKIQQDIQSYVW